MKGRPELDRRLSRQIAWAAGLEFVELDTAPISPATFRKVPSACARRYRCVPLIFNSRRIVLVTDDASAPFILDREKLRQDLGVGDERPVEFRIAATDALERRLAVHASAGE